MIKAKIFLPDGRCYNLIKLEDLTPYTELSSVTWLTQPDTALRDAVLRRLTAEPKAEVCNYSVYTRDPVNSGNYVSQAKLTEAPKDSETLTTQENAALWGCVKLLRIAGGIASHLKRGIYYNMPDERAKAVAMYFELGQSIPSELIGALGTVTTLPGYSRRVLHGLLGQIDEVAELSTPLMNIVSDPTSVDKANIAEELGDQNWYSAIIMDALGIEFDSVLQTNINKLKKRYPQGYQDAAAQKRDLPAERQVLEAGVAPQTG